MKNWEGIIEEKRNPFVVGRKGRKKRTYWIDQGYKLTNNGRDKRARQLAESELFGKTEAQIREIKNVNLSDYLAFIAIRWGYAVMTDGVFTPTQKWWDEYQYLIAPGGKDNKESQSRRGFELKAKSTTQPKPKQHSETSGRDELVKQLRAFNPAPVICRYRDKDLAGKSPDEILTRFTFGRSIARAFRYETPSKRYERWRWYSNAEEMLKKLNGIKSRDMFEKFALQLGESLVEDWGKLNERGQRSRMNIGIGMKIVNLALKHLAYSDHCSNPDLKEWLHVPWDKFTLKPLQNIWTGRPAIPSSPSQGFVDTLFLYRQLQELIADITQEAGVVTIIYEFWTWDRAH